MTVSSTCGTRQTLRQFQAGEGARRRQEAVFGVLGIEPRLDGMAADLDIVLPHRQRLAAAALEIIAAHPSLQAEFESAFLEMPMYAPSEFVEVCMHALRWPNVQREFEARCRAAVARNDWRSEPVYRHYLESFEPDWEDASDFCASYFEQRQ